MSWRAQNTSSHMMRMFWNMEKSEMLEKHILFQEEDQSSYVKTMLEKAML